MAFNIIDGGLLGIFVEGGLAPDSPAKSADLAAAAADFTEVATGIYDLSTDLSAGGNGNGVGGGILIKDETLTVVPGRRSNLQIRNRPESTTLIINSALACTTPDRCKFVSDGQLAVATTSFDRYELLPKSASEMSYITCTDCEVQLRDDVSVQLMTEWTFVNSTVRNINSGPIVLQHTGSPPPIGPNSGPITLVQL